MKDFQLRAWVVVKISKFICELHTDVSLIPLNLLDLKISRHFSHQPRIKNKTKITFALARFSSFAPVAFICFAL